LSGEEHTTRTVRIEEWLDDVLRDEAEKNGKSVNSIVEDLIRRYAENDRFFTRDQLINLSPTTLSSLVNRLEEEEVFTAGREAGRTNALNNLLIRGMPLDYESVKWFIMDVLDGYSGWFRCSYHEMGDHYLFHLRHGLSRKWSCFIDAYLESMLKSTLDVDVAAEILNGTVTIRIPVSSI
jgi:hypothetical protein